tara:strand:+ start:70 stop:471 length:402 start_codon:yes stop_codon:yes gene_type:complete
MGRDKKWSSNDRNQLLTENFRKFMEEGDFSPTLKENDSSPLSEDDWLKILANLNKAQRLEPETPIEKYAALFGDEMEPGHFDVGLHGREDALNWRDLVEAYDISINNAKEIAQRMIEMSKENRDRYAADDLGE